MYSETMDSETICNPTVIDSGDLRDAVARLCIEASYDIEKDVLDAWLRAYHEERSELAREMLALMVLNADIARRRETPLCQDTGQMVFYVEIGTNVKVEGQPIEDAINAGVEIGGESGFLRRSVVANPLDRNGSGTYGPAVIHYEFVPGDEIRLFLLPAGCGPEQVCRAEMFPPVNEMETIRKFVLHAVRAAGSRPCPPIVLGVGIGGDLEQSALLAKKALRRPLGSKSAEFSDLETQLLTEVNALNIGPQGFGGDTTALAVHIESSPCHRANLPIAVAFNCHLSRHKSAVLGSGSRPAESRVGVNQELADFVAAANPESLFRDYVPVHLPLDENTLQAGTKVLLTGTLYSARDMAHKKLLKLMEDGHELPFDLRGALIYYTGPTPPRPGRVEGAIGPTTSYRMDSYTPRLLDEGLTGMVGKGARSEAVIEAIKRNGGVYFATLAGMGSLLSERVKGSEIIAFPELGTEAIRKLEVVDFPAIVAVDAYGDSIYGEHASL